MMGGLINGATVKGDLWIIEAGGSTLSCYPVATTAEGPGPRVGHASLLVGNAFIVFGGDTKIDDSDVLDDTLYLLNTGDFTAFDFAALLLTFFQPPSNGLEPCRQDQDQPGATGTPSIF